MNVQSSSDLVVILNQFGEGSKPVKFDYRGNTFTLSYNPNSKKTFAIKKDREMICHNKTLAFNDTAFADRFCSFANSFYK